MGEALQLRIAAAQGRSRTMGWEASSNRAASAAAIWSPWSWAG
jgi:hypothetical protein